MKLILRTLFVSAILAAAVGFSIHVVTYETIRSWVATRMAGISTLNSIDVWVPAALSSIEVGLAASLVYFLLRPQLVRFCFPARVLILCALALALKGRLFRQPLMDALIGNPLDVVLVQNGSVWLTWLAIAFIVVITVDHFSDGGTTNRPPGA